MCLIYFFFVEIWDLSHFQTGGLSVLPVANQTSVHCCLVAVKKMKYIFLEMEPILYACLI